MSKVEQESRIQQVRGSLSAFDNPGPAAYAAGAGMFPLVVLSSILLTRDLLDSSAIQDDRDTSGDEDDSEESEEE